MSWNARVRCVNDEGKSNVKGEIYNILNGRLEYKSGNYSMEIFENIDDLNDGLISKFELINCENCKHCSCKLNLKYIKQYCYPCIQGSNWESKDVTKEE